MLDTSKNYFELFGLPTRYAVDAKHLAERYRALQAITRPDRFAATVDQERRGSTRASVRFNDAYRTLKDPLERARYLLGLHTGHRGDDRENTRDGGFLMEQMELRETLAEAQSSPDPNTAVAQVLTHLAERSVALDKELEGLFAEPSTENLAVARELVHKLQLIDECRRTAENLEVDPQDRRQGRG